MTRSEFDRITTVTSVKCGGTVADVDLTIEERIDSCPYSFYFNKVTWYYDDGTVTLQGRVPTFHLKQVLQTMLQDVQHVQRLINDVHVVSATGLSSELCT